MDSERWKLIEEIYHHVQARPVEHRAALLAESCADDPELRDEIESLLAARARAEGFLSPEEMKSHIARLCVDPPASAAGSTLGPYEILSALGAGAMGEVYRARDTRLDRQVALKLLPPQFTHDASRVARFRLEAKAASALNHPNIVTIYEIGEIAGTWFIAAELIEGVTLRERLAASKMPIEETVGLTLQCASALAAAHRTGILHRDIKPENIMVRSDGVAKVVDFGLARISEGGPEWTAQATLAGSVMGTPRYMSPEQARGQNSDARSDVFSLGAVLFEMIAGRPAFPGTTTAEVFAALLHSEPSNVDAGLAQPILARALAKDPANRYPSMEEFAGDLRRLDGRQPRLAWWGLPRRLRAQATWRRAWITALLAIPVVAAYVGLHTRDVREEREFNLVPLTTFPGLKDYPAFSPDGSSIAFSWRPPGEQWLHIYVKAEGQQDPVQLTSSPHNDVLPAWSPDGNSIAFCRESAPGRASHLPHDIYIVPSRSGPQRRVAQGWQGVSWSPDGKTIAAAGLPRVTGTTTPAAGGIFVLSLDSGKRRDLTTGYPDLRPVFSPDGRWIAYLRRYFGVAEEVFVVPAGGGEPRRLTFDHQPLRGATWTADSREVIFASWRSAAQGSLWRVPVRGGTAKPVSAALRDASSPNIGRRGDRLAYNLEWMDTNIYVRASRNWRQGAPQFDEPGGSISSSRIDHSPSFSPDGERVAFISNRSGNQEIWVSRRDGSQAFALTSFGAASTGAPRFSPDGKWIAFDSAASGTSAIYVVKSGGGMPRVISAVPTGSWYPSWSPDGKWIYFTCRLAGTRQIWKVPATGGSAVQVTYAGAYEAKPRPDGGLVYFTKPARDGCCAIWSVPPAGGPEAPVPELQRFDRIQRSWGVTQDGIYFVARQDAHPPTAQFMSLRAHTVTRLFAMEKENIFDLPGLALSPDGRFAAAVQLDQSVNDLMMIGNFR